MYTYVYHNIEITGKLSDERVSEYTQTMKDYIKEHEYDKMLHIKAKKLSTLLIVILYLLLSIIVLGLLAFFCHGIANTYANKVFLKILFIDMGIFAVTSLFIIKNNYTLKHCLAHRILCFYLCPKYNIPYRTQDEIRGINEECERINKVLRRVNFSKMIDGMESIKCENPIYEISICPAYLKFNSTIIDKLNNSVLYREPIIIPLTGVEAIPEIDCLTLNVAEGKAYLPVNKDGQIVDESNKFADSEVSIELAKKLICEAIDNIPSCAVIKDCYVEHSFGATEAFIKINIKVKEETTEAVQEFHEAAHNAFNTSMGFIS